MKRILLVIGITLLLGLSLQAQTVQLMPVPKMQFLDSSGNPLASGKVFTYIAGTTTDQATYTDSTGATPNANPVILDAGGFANIWLDVSLTYKFLVKSSADVTQYTVDNVSSGASATSLKGTFTTTTFSATPTCNAAIADICDITLTGNVTSSTISNASNGQMVTLIIRQDATGGRTFVFPSDTVRRLGVVDLTASAVSSLTFTYDGTNWEEVNVSGLALGTANLDVGRFNGIRYPDGTTFATIAAAVDDCPSTGCTIQDFRTGTITPPVDPFLGHNFPITLITGDATYEIPTTTGVIMDYSFDLPSDFTWVANNTTIQPDVVASAGSAGQKSGLLTARTTDTTGTFNLATDNTLVVASATNADVGDLVGVVAAGTRFTQQATQIDNATRGCCTDSITTIDIDEDADANGWGTGTNYFLINNSEIIVCTGEAGGTPNTLTGCTRGAYGSTAAVYTGGETVDALGYFIAEITKVTGTTLTLDASSTRAVTSAPVLIGSKNITLRGSLTLDGRQDPNAADPSQNVAGFFGSLMNGLIVEDSVRFTKLDHAGVHQNASRNSHVGGSFSCIGRTADTLGWDVLFFGQSIRNNFSTVSHRGCDLNGDGTFDSGNIAMAMDSRSGDFSLTDGSPESNSGTVGPIYYPEAGLGFGVFIHGGIKNSVYATSIDTGNNGININGGQWFNDGVQVALTPTDNFVSCGYTKTVVTISAFAVGGNNHISCAKIGAGSSSIADGNTAFFGSNSAEVARLYGNLWLMQDEAGDTLSIVFRDNATNNWEWQLDATNGMRLLDSSTSLLRELLVAGANGNSEYNADGTGTVRHCVRNLTCTNGTLFGDGAGNTVASINGAGLGDFNRISATGTALVTGDFNFETTGEWGDTADAAVSAITGNDQWFQFTMTAGGANTGASPDIRITYKDLTWTTAPIPICVRQDFNAPTPIELTVSSTATVLTIVFNGTPTVTNTYKFACQVGGI